MIENNVPGPSTEPKKCIEWTGAGGDYFLAVVVERDAVIGEYWGTRKAVLMWMETYWPQLPRKFAPMVYTPLRRERKLGKDKGMGSKKLSSIAAVGF